MQVVAIKTRPILPPQDDLLAVLGESIPSLPENTIVAVSSKVVSIWRGRCVKLPEGAEEMGFKDEYAINEAERYIPREETPHRVLHTIVNGMRIGSGGVDLSNGNGYLTLWPQDPDRDAEEIAQCLRSRYGVQNIGIIIVDSNSVPLRNGVMGLAIGYSGFLPLRDYRGRKDVFGRELHFERTNVADCLASAAVCEMGEGGECTPCALITDVHDVVFTTERPRADLFLSLKVPQEEDIFEPFFRNAPWKRGGMNT